MKQFLLLCFLGIISQASIAQTVFCPEGARWIYYTPAIGLAYEQQSHYIYEGDTIINGFDAKILKSQSRVRYPWGESSYSESSTYLRQSNDSILQLVNGNFELMFDYNVQAGDQRIVHIGEQGLCTSQDTMLIDSVTTISYQDQNLRKYYFKLLVQDQLSPHNGNHDAYYLGGGKGIFVEKIGLMSNHPANIRIICVDGNTSVEYSDQAFTCYTDNELAANFPDTCNLFLGIENERMTNNSEIIFSNQYLQVKNASKSTLHVYDMLGKELLQTVIQSDNEALDVSQLPNGMLVVVLDNGISRVAKKVVKTSR